MPPLTAPKRQNCFRYDPNRINPHFIEMNGGRLHGRLGTKNCTADVLPLNIRKAANRSSSGEPPRKPLSNHKSYASSTTSRSTPDTQIACGMGIAPLLCFWIMLCACCRAANSKHRGVTNAYSEVISEGHASMGAAGIATFSRPNPLLDNRIGLTNQSGSTVAVLSRPYPRKPLLSLRKISRCFARCCSRLTI